MSMLKVACEDQVLYLVESTTIASGGVNEVKISFDFCPKWDGFLKTVVFYQKVGDPYYAILDFDNVAVIPWEVMRNPGVLNFGVFGVKDNVTRTSEVMAIRIVPGAITAELEPEDPTPDIYLQLLAEYNAIRETMENAVNDTSASASAARTSAESAARSETAATNAVSEIETLVNGFETEVDESTTASKSELSEHTELLKNELDVFAGEQEGDLRKDLDSIPRPNLLDNWYFGDPVNQRGQTEYTGAGYTVDRWKTVSGDVVAKIGEKLVMDNSQSTNTAYCGQNFEENLVGCLVTLSVLTTEGLYHNSGVVLDNNSWQLRSPIGESAELYFQKSAVGAQGVFFAIQAGAVLDILAAKLELGEGQTLAHQDENGKWILNEIPDYTAELLKCQRYQVELMGTGSSTGGVGVGIAQGTTSAIVLITLPNHLAKTPTIVWNGSMSLWDGENYIAATAINMSRRNGNRILVTVGATGLTQGKAYILRANNDSTARVLVDANL